MGITIEEIQDHFSDIRVRTYFQVLGMDPDDIQRLFQLIDQDESGEVEVNEFLDGCLRLKGEARSIDLHTVMYDCKACLRHTAEMVGYLQSKDPTGAKGMFTHKHHKGEAVEEPGLDDPARASLVSKL